MLTPRSAVRDALDILKSPLRAFVRESMKPHVSFTSARDESWSDPDTARLLGAILDHWELVFANLLPRRARGLVVDLKQVRNRWAHEESFTWDQAISAVLTAGYFHDMLSPDVAENTARAQIENLKRAAMQYRLSSGQEPPASSTMLIRPPAGQAISNEPLSAHAEGSGTSLHQADTRQSIQETSEPSESDFVARFNPSMDLVEFFEDIGYDCIDNRRSGPRGTLWVVGSSPQLNHLMYEMFRKHEVLFKFREVGGTATRGRPAWRLIKASVRGVRGA